MKKIIVSTVLLSLAYYTTHAGQSETEYSPLEPQAAEIAPISPAPTAEKAIPAQVKGTDQQAPVIPSSGSYPVQNRSNKAAQPQLSPLQEAQARIKNEAQLLVSEINNLDRAAQSIGSQQKRRLRPR